MKSPSLQSVQTALDPVAWALAGQYAEALLGLLIDDARAEEIAVELADVVTAVDGVPGSGILFSLPILDDSRREEMVKHIFAGRVSQVTEAFLGVLARHGRMELLREAGSRFRALLDEREGKIDVTVTSAVALDEDEKVRIAEALREAMGGQVAVRSRTDEGLIGGITVRVGDKRYDASLFGRLQRLKRLLAGNDNAGKR